MLTNKLVPLSTGRGLGSPNDIIALFPGEDIIKNGGVEPLILWQRCLLEVDDRFPDRTRVWLREEFRREREC